VIEGIERLSSLPRGTEALGFYKDKAQYVPIATIRLASEIPAADRPAFEYLDTGSASFAEYLRIRSHRLDDFYRQSADGVDLCNVQVPVRRKVAGERG
jgi:peptidylprolyl isomerase